MPAFQEEWVLWWLHDVRHMCYYEGLNQVPWICIENRKLNVILHLKFWLHGMMCNIRTMRIMICFEQNTSQILTNVYPAVIISGLLQNVDYLYANRYRKCARDWSLDPALNSSKPELTYFSCLLFVIITPVIAHFRHQFVYKWSLSVRFVTTHWWWPLG